MKILIIQPWIRLGGAEWVSVRLTRELVEMGNEARLVALFLEPEGLPSDYAKVEYVMPNRFIRALISRSRLMFYLLGVPMLFLLVLSHSKGVDLLNPHNFPASWVASLVGALRGIPTLWTCNEPPSRITGRQARHIGIGEMIGWSVASGPLDRFFVRHISAIHVLSEKTQSEVESRYHRGSTVIRSSVDWSFLDRSCTDDMARKYGIRGRFILLTVGKLHPQKNHMLCLQALPDVIRQIDDALLVIVGDGPMRRPLQELARDLKISDHVLFLGRVPSQDLPGLYRACNVLLLPALNQSWGLTPFEALCAKRISIVSDDSGAAEVLGREDIGVVAKPEPSEFARSIIQVHSDPEKYDALARDGYAYVVNYLNPRLFAEQFLDLAIRTQRHGVRTSGPRWLESERQGS
jgi:phosphatidylinositol alpha-1,6-mannosyltransferase